MTALHEELSNAEFKSNKPNNTVLVSLIATVKKKKKKNTAKSYATVL